MIFACLTVVFTALVSAFFPVMPVEPYLVGLAAATSYSPIALGLAAAMGQTIGKATLFLGVRGALHSDRLHRWVEAAEARRDRRRETARAASNPGSTLVRERLQAPLAPLVAFGRRLLVLLHRPSLAAPILLLSATTGLPPLMATSICAAGTRINLPLFLAACFVGRSIRFIALAYAPQLVLV